MRSSAATRRRFPERLAAAGLAFAVALGRAGAVEGAASSATLGHAEALLRVGDFARAEDELRRFLRRDPQHRWAREMLAFALESRGDLEGELRIRAALAAETPSDSRAQWNFGRALERFGDYGGALAAYRRAEAADGESEGEAELEAAIDRLEGRTAVEVATVASTEVDPNATASRIQGGAAVPVASLAHVAVVAGGRRTFGHADAGSAVDGAITASLVLEHPSGAALVAGPRFHATRVDEVASADLALGGALSGRLPLGTYFTLEAAGELDAPWDDSATAVRHGGRSTGAGGFLHAHLLSWRLLLQAGMRARRFTVVSISDPATDRPEATQTLFVGGVDVVVWRNVDRVVPGEMLDDALALPAALTEAITVGYRHYEAFTDAESAFEERIVLVERGSIDEASVGAAFVPGGGPVGLEVRAGLGRDASRDAIIARVGPGVVWAPTRTVRLSARYEGTNETAGGFAGQRHGGWVGAHVDF